MLALSVRSRLYRRESKLADFQLVKIERKDLHVRSVNRFHSSKLVTHKDVLRNLLSYNHLS